MEPDYGTMLKREGLGDVPHFIYGAQLFDLAMCAPNLFTSFSNKLWGGVWYAVSLDISPAALKAIYEKATPQAKTEIAQFLLDARPGANVTFSEPVTLDLKTTLGTPQTGATETFIPLAVEAVL